MDETISQLQDKSKDIKKELKIVFAGEEAIDEGGVKKEFFQILMRDLFNADLGMFRYLEKTRYVPMINPLPLFAEAGRKGGRRK